jgi:hypothetical protein
VEEEAEGGGSGVVISLGAEPVLLWEGAVTRSWMPERRSCPEAGSDELAGPEVLLPCWFMMVCCEGREGRTVEGEEVEKDVR